jgi:glycerol-3-phosphate responsive antiterminator
MNRHQRRKLSRHATNDEIFPGGHAPIQSSARDKMLAIMQVLKDTLPGFEITLFIAERKASEGRTEPRFNYASTAAREDMYAVLRAFLAKNEAIGATLDQIADAPPTDSKQ